MPEDIKICRAQQQDWPYIKEKIEKYLLDGKDIAWEQFFIAKLGDKTVAFGRIIDRGTIFEIGSLGVDYYHRKKGIGLELLNFIIEETKKIDPSKPIYGITHVPGFVVQAGFKEVPDCPPELEAKKASFHIDPSRIKIMKYTG